MCQFFGPTGQPFDERLARWADNVDSIGPAPQGVALGWANHGPAGADQVLPRNLARPVDGCRSAQMVRSSLDSRPSSLDSFSILPKYLPMQHTTQRYKSTYVAAQSYKPRGPNNLQTRATPKTKNKITVVSHGSTRRRAGGTKETNGGATAIPL
jgi:hypothetical protein